MPIAQGRLNCVGALSARRPLARLIEEALHARLPADDIRRLYGDVYLVYTDAGTAAIRDWLTPCLEDDESLIVVEFETWSGYGPALDRRWLLSRGH